MNDGRDETAKPKEKRARRFDDLLSSERATRILYLIVGAVFIAFVFRHLQFSTGSVCCGDFDGYYHIRWSRILWDGIKSGQVPPPFTWLPLTTLDQQGYVDHHLLFHLLQIPFTFFGNLTMGAKVAATLFGALAVFSCYWLIVRYRISYTLIWLLALLACAGPFLYRLNMAKAPPIAIIFMVAGVYLLFEKKYWMLGPLMFLFAWTYSMFPTLFLAAVIWAGVMAWSEGRFEWRPVAWTGIGMIAGLIINPYFPKNIRLFLQHVSMKLTPGEFSTSVGQEWYPYDSWVFLGNCLVAFIAMLVGYVAFNASDRRRSARALFFLVFSTVLMIATFRSRRFVEYWPPFAVLFAAFSLQLLFERGRGMVGALPAEVQKELQPFLDKQGMIVGETQEEEQPVWKTILAGSIAVILFVVMIVNIKGIKRFGVSGVAGEIAASDPPDKYQRGMAWIQANVPAGERVFNTDWDDFPKMFFYDTSHSYISGLDPTYLLNKNPELAKLYEEVTLGRHANPAEVIQNRFGARYVFSDKEQVHDDFYAKAIESGWFDQVYEDDDCFILHIRDEKGEPPAEALEGDSPQAGDDDEMKDDGGELPPEEDEGP